MIQLTLAVTGAASILLIACGRRAGFLIGLAVQPLWFHTCYVHRQWGGMLVAAFSTISFAIGVRRSARPDPPGAEAARRPDLDA